MQLHSRSRSLPPPRSSLNLTEQEEEEEGDDETDDWGHFSCAMSDDEQDSECDDFLDETGEGKAGAAGEDDTDLTTQSIRRKKHTNRFASSRYSRCGACASRYTLGVSACSSMKNLSSAVLAAAHMASFSDSQDTNVLKAEEQRTPLRTASLPAADPRASEQLDALLPAGEANDSVPRSRSVPGQALLSSPADQIEPAAPTKRTKPSHDDTIEARVRKRCDDFCGQSRGVKSARWKVERWHVASPRHTADYMTNSDGLVLSPAHRPRVATRFFRLADGPAGQTITFSMGSIRVVSTHFERYAQYELVVDLNGHRGSAWRRYSAFRALVASVAAESAPRNIVRTLSAWADAQDAKRFFRCTHPAYLIQRYYNFEHVLREALFELQTPQLLLAFFEPDDDDHSIPPSSPHVPVSPDPISSPSSVGRQTWTPFLSAFLGLAPRRPFAVSNDLVAHGHQVRCH